MMDAQIFGGAGVSIMVFKTDFERAVADKGAGLSSVAGQLKKLASGDLRKAAFADQLAALQDIRADMDRLQAIADRRQAALPAFVAWKNNKPFVAATPTGTIRDYGAGHLVVSKSADSFSDLGEALKARAITPLETGQRSTIDPSANVTDAMLARRFQGGQP
jgi:ABC-type transporter Mla subunit MlaD